jgi:hypothetical protein
VKQPAEFAREVEEHPELPPGTDERVSGYGVMGLPFRSGHVLGLRRWTASSVGEGFTSIWHRDPQGQWTFYESAPSEVACTRYFGADVARARLVPIALEWDGPSSMRIVTEDLLVDWTVEIGSSFVTRALSAVGSSLPLAAWRSGPVLETMGRLAGRVLRAGTVKLTGSTSNEQHFDANPMRLWYVTESRASVDGEDLGPIGPLTRQAHIADFYVPQRGILAIGRVFVTPTARTRQDDVTDLRSSGSLS